MAAVLKHQKQGYYIDSEDDDEFEDEDNIRSTSKLVAYADDEEEEIASCQRHAAYTSCAARQEDDEEEDVTNWEKHMAEEDDDVEDISRPPPVATVVTADSNEMSDVSDEDDREEEKEPTKDSNESTSGNFVKKSPHARSPNKKPRNFPAFKASVNHNLIAEATKKKMSPKKQQVSAKKKAAAPAPAPAPSSVVAALEDHDDDEVARQELRQKIFGPDSDEEEDPAPSTNNRKLFDREEEEDEEEDSVMESPRPPLPAASRRTPDMVKTNGERTFLPTLGESSSSPDQLRKMAAHAVGSSLLARRISTTQEEADEEVYREEEPPTQKQPSVPQKPATAVVGGDATAPSSKYQVLLQDALKTRLLSPDSARDSFFALRSNSPGNFIKFMKTLIPAQMIKSEKDSDTFLMDVFKEWSHVVTCFKPYPKMAEFLLVPQIVKFLYGTTNERNQLPGALQRLFVMLAVSELNGNFLLGPLVADEVLTGVASWESGLEKFITPFCIAQYMDSLEDPISARSMLSPDALKMLAWNHMTLLADTTGRPNQAKLQNMFLVLRLTVFLFKGVFFRTTGWTENGPADLSKYALAILLLARIAEPEMFHKQEVGVRFVKFVWKQLFSMLSEDEKKVTKTSPVAHLAKILVTKDLVRLEELRENPPPATADSSSAAAAADDDEQEEEQEVTRKRPSHEEKPPQPHSSSITVEVSPLSAPATKKSRTITSPLLLPTSSAAAEASSSSSSLGEELFLTCMQKLSKSLYDDAMPALVLAEKVDRMKQFFKTF